MHDGFLWVCGSHCRVRQKPKPSPGDMPGVQRVVHKLRARPSRHLLGRVRLSDDGGGLVGKGEHLPFEKQGTLCGYLADSTFLGPFLQLPSKENGLDIEGLALTDRGTVLLGLRGPLVDSFAVVVELAFPKKLSLKGATPISRQPPHSRRRSISKCRTRSISFPRFGAARLSRRRSPPRGARRALPKASRDTGDKSRGSR
jgi:Protein of unknown function (DUF3616)